MPIGCQDFRVYTAWRRHPKRLKLMRELGAAGVLAIEDLWAFATDSYPSGHLSDLGPAEIEEAVNWRGDAGAFVEAVVRIRLLDECTDGSYELHDWAEWQPYVIDAPKRVERARLGGQESARKRQERKQQAVQLAVQLAVEPAAPLKAPLPSHPIRVHEGVPVHGEAAKPPRTYRLRDTRGKGKG